MRKTLVYKMDEKSGATAKHKWDLKVELSLEVT